MTIAIYFDLFPFLYTSKGLILGNLNCKRCYLIYNSNESARKYAHYPQKSFLCRTTKSTDSTYFQINYATPTAKIQITYISLTINKASIFCSFTCSGSTENRTKKFNKLSEWSIKEWVVDKNMWVWTYLKIVIFCMEGPTRRI